MVEAIENWDMDVQNYSRVYRIQKLLESAENYKKSKNAKSGNPVRKRVFDPSLEFYEVHYAAGIFGNPKIGVDEILTIISLGSTISSLALGVPIPPWISSGMDVINLVRTVQEKGDKAVRELRFTLQDKINGFEKVFGDITIDTKRHCITILKESQYKYGWESEKEYKKNIEKTCRVSLALFESGLAEGKDLAINSINNYLLKLPKDYFKKYNQRTIEECAYALMLASKTTDEDFNGDLGGLSSDALDWLRHYRKERNLNWWGIRQAERKMVTVYNAILEAEKKGLIETSEEQFWLGNPWEYFEDLSKQYGSFKYDGLPETPGGNVNTFVTAQAVNIFKEKGYKEEAKNLKERLVELNERNAWPFEKGDLNDVNSTGQALSTLKDVNEEEISKIIKNGTKWLCAVLPQMEIKTDKTKIDFTKYNMIAANGILGLSAYSK